MIAYAQDRPPLDALRPLAVAAAYSREFVCLAPPHWSAAIVLAQLFKCLDMERAGWTERKTDLRNGGSRGWARVWVVTREE